MTPQERKLMQMALETLVTCRITNEFEPGSGVLKEIDDSITALRAALAQPEKTNQCGEVCERAKLCSVCARGLAQPEQEKKVWHALTTEEVTQAWEASRGVEDRLAAFYKNMDDRLREKNNGYDKRRA